VAVAVLPLVLWSVVVALRPGDLPLARTPWWLIGLAALLIVTGAAALASRHLVADPGTVLAPIVAVVVIAPVVVAGMLGWDTLYPIGTFPDSVRAAWFAVAGLGLLVCGLAFRPGLRP
jgi:hypothetical protein